jgi:hypothetical protein
LDISTEDIEYHENWAEQRGAVADDDDFVLEPGDDRALRRRRSPTRKREATTGTTPR